MSGADERERRALALFAEALDVPEASREAWLDERCGGDDALKARVLGLLRADSASAGMIRTGGAGYDSDLLEDPAPERAGGYRIVTLIGRGGMGSVYVGERDLGDFEHQVAIKVIRPGVLRRSLIERFERERQILASLNHPNIARLYDGGYLDDGSPYMVMELVDGDPVLDWVAARDAGPATRLALFEDVCRAISHAHQNLIVHRDITPNNVLVTGDGLVKVIDFGIAKPHDLSDDAAPEGEQEKQTASLSYTPGYAAPERASGAPANTLSDVYSLGKLLRDLFATHMPADIAAIVAKATATAPEDRYNSVDALREDLQRYREDRPVAARKGGPGYVFSKYVARNRIAVGLTGLVVASLCVGLITTTLLYQRAEAERAAADERFSQVRSLASFMMFDLYDELEKTSGNTRTISMLADEAEVYLQSLAADGRASLEVKLDTIVGLKRLADIMGNPKNSHMGKRAEAGVLLETALEEAERLHAAHPGDPDVMRSLADVAFSAATHTYITTEKYQHAHDLAARSAELWGALAARPDATFNDARQSVRAYMLTAVPLPWIGRHEEAVAILREAREKGQALVAAHPDEVEALNLLGSINVELARALTRYANNAQVSQETMPYWNDAIALRHAAYERAPDDIKPYRSLVTIYYERGAAWRELDNFDRAYEDTLKSEAIAEELLAKDPDDAWVARILGGIREEKIKTLSYAGRHDEALELADEALQAARAEAEAYPEDIGILREWGYTLVLIGDAYLRAGREATGCALVGEARAVWERLAGDGELSEVDQNVSLVQLQALEAQCPA